ncbi:flightin [Drosophila grimshawi]|uniref:GH14726 n=1 Tax=Drosophila grimshawi TaxID=7222 RepID=B4IWY1_DROGR|nr:flightin [Drosophila grimshawi]XP_032597105.1 flightin [Drosophila grimshawi]XP_032597115.1 flightin [Drosophila grimshawi]XP_032597116.1 flightin [Drosophila grimshawi]EDV97382.1 GH14726 [Drosophila grimshawi]
MGDEEDPWGFDDEGESDAKTAGSVDAVPSKAESIKSEQRSETQAAPEEQENIAEPEVEAKAPPPPPEDDGYRKPVQLYRHWVRPKFLQYKYMYNYRTNYYDDVIDYLDKKQVGVSREIPRPQTWAERVLRTRDINGNGIDNYAQSTKRDKHLIQTLAASIRTYNYHTKAYINQKYAGVI